MRRALLRDTLPGRRWACAASSATAAAACFASAISAELRRDLGGENDGPRVVCRRRDFWSLFRCVCRDGGDAAEPGTRCLKGSRPSGRYLRSGEARFTVRPNADRFFGAAFALCCCVRCEESSRTLIFGGAARRRCISGDARVPSSRSRLARRRARELGESSIASFSSSEARWRALTAAAILICGGGDARVGCGGGDARDGGAVPSPSEQSLSASCASDFAGVAATASLIVPRPTTPLSPGKRIDLRKRSWYDPPCARIDELAPAPAPSAAAGWFAEAGVSCLAGEFFDACCCC